MEYSDGFIELYDLIEDPYEMDNIATTVDQTLLEHFSKWLQVLAKCSGNQCSSLDKGPDG